MPNLAQAANLAGDPEFRARLQSALIQRSAVWLAAPPPALEGGKVAWRRRRRSAAEVTAHPDGALAQIAPIVANNDAVLTAYLSPTTGGQAGIPDAVVEAAVDLALAVLLRVANLDDDNA